MKKEATAPTVQEVVTLYNAINFPEYQREPTVWDRKAKQRLIDSIVRNFDIASIYFYENQDGTIDCIDGRQRLNALMSFLGDNKQDTADNGFVFSPMNEIVNEKDHPFAALDGLTFSQIEFSAKEATAANVMRHKAAARFLKDFRAYRVAIIRLAGSHEPDEFNLQFTRLNLGVIINSGEKLHAMIGALRDVCFKRPGGLGEHPFLGTAKIPTRRFAREQVAAQIVCQIFSLEADNRFARTRHFDLQLLFKEHATLGAREVVWVAGTRRLLDLLAEAFATPEILRNRAVTVSTVLLAWRAKVRTLAEARIMAKFMEVFLVRLQWQVRKGLDVDSEYRYLIDFQRHLTQASVEVPAVTHRANVLEEEFARWKSTSKLRGDTEYRARTRRDPDKESAK